MLKNKINKLIKNNIYFILLSSILFFTIISTNYYSIYKKNQEYRLQNALDNIFFKKSINKIFENLNPKFSTINIKRLCTIFNPFYFKPYNLHLISLIMQMNSLNGIINIFGNYPNVKLH